jgi:hypothetical protein
MAMNLAQLLQQRWAAAEPLCALLPAERVYAGMSMDPALPYAVIRKTGDRPIAACNNGSAVNAVLVQIEVFHGNYEAALAVVEQVKAALDRSAFDLADGGRVIRVERTNDFEQHNDDGVWQMVIDFRCTVYLPPAP